jgi:tetratricopeptide (TPR) repeat protein
MKTHQTKQLIVKLVLPLLLATNCIASVAQTIATDRVSALQTGSALQTAGFQQPKNIPTINLVALTSPMSFGALRILLNEADSLYRSERLTQAQDTIVGLLELEPNFAPAWLRLGNVWQTQGKTQWAMEAYQIAIQGELQLNSAEEAKLYNEAKLKALLNVSALHLNQARNSQLKIESLQDQLESFAQIREEQESQLAELENEQRRLSTRTAAAKSDRPQMIVGRAR